MENNESKSNKYDYFDVTADIGFYAYGNSLDEAYENAGLAMFNVITDISKVKKDSFRGFGFSFIRLFRRTPIPAGYRVLVLF